MKTSVSGWPTARWPLACALLSTVLPGPAAAQPLDAAVQAAPVAGPGLNFKPLVPGLLFRTRFDVSEPGGRRVQLLDLLVGPGKRSGRTSFEGPTVIELRAGEAALMIGDQPQRISSGATVHIPARVAIEITNLRADLDVSLRATVVTEVPR